MNSEPRVGCPAPLAPAVLVGADHRSIDHRDALIGSMAPGQSGQHRLEHAQIAPAGEAAPDRVPLAVPLWDRSPTRALARLSQHTVQMPSVLVAQPPARYRYC